MAERAPKSANFYRKLSWSLGRCIAPLLIVYSDNSTPQHLLYSGFLLGYRGYAFWVTAGHVIRSIAEIRDATNVRVLKAHWLDGCEADSTENSIPVDLANLDLVPIFTDEIDLGLVPLSEYYFNLFIANDDNEFLTEDMWGWRSRSKRNQFTLLGYPEEMHDVSTVPHSNGRSSATLNAKLLCLPCERVLTPTDDSVPEFWENGRVSSIYARLLDVDGPNPREVNNIEFMSGGPLFSVDYSYPNGARFLLEGIQRSWLPDSRIIRATKIEVLASIIDQSIENLPKPEVPPEE